MASVATVFPLERCNQTGCLKLTSPATVRDPATIFEMRQDELAAVTHSIINGETDVWEPFYKYTISLPVVMK